MKWTLVLLLWVLTIGLSYSQIARFSSDAQSGCSPLLVTFDGKSSDGSNLAYSWEFGNGNAATGKDKSTVGAIYTKPGIYSVKLTVSNSNGSHTETKTSYITVFEKPGADFNVSGVKKIGCIPFLVSFQDLSPPGDAPISSWTWDFGDGQSATVQNPTHQYKTPGDYTVTLITVDKNGCTNSITKQNFIKVTRSINAGFTTSSGDKDLKLCNAPATLSFINKSKFPLNSNIQYIWNFGDGAVSNNPNPTHSYTSSGVFDVSLTLKDLISGCTDIITKPSLVTIHDYSTDFAVETGGCSPLIANFKNLSKIPSSPTYYYEWDFGDGNKSNATNPTHSYTKPGNFSVSLTIKDSSGTCSFSPLTKNNLINVPVSGTIDFSANKRINCTAPLTASFKDLSDKGINWLWDFGDGTTSSDPNPTHTYNALGEYNVTLTVTEASGCKKILKKDKYIWLGEPRPDFTISKKGGCIPLNVAFNDISISPDQIVSWHWDFGDGTTSNEAAPNHVYSQIGKYTATLKITTSNGCTSISSSKLITAGTKPKVAFNTDEFPKTGCKPLSHTFKNLTEGVYDSIWIQPEVEVAGNQGESVTIYPGQEKYDHVYDWDPEFYNPFMLAFHNGCIDTFSYENAIRVLPPKGYIRYTIPQCFAGPVAFRDSSFGAHRVHWDFGTGNPKDTSTERNPNFTYPKPGVYQVILTTWYDEAPYHCKDTVSVYVTIPTYGKSDLNLSSDIQKGCYPTTITFNPTINYTDNQSQVNTYSWNFGNGKSSAEKNPAIVFDKAGAYNITLIVKSTKGCIDTIQKKEYIKIYGPTANFTDPTPGCFPHKVTLKDLSTSIAPIVKRTWNMGDGAVLVGKDSSINHTYRNILPGFNAQKQGLSISLSVQDKEGCTSSVSKPIRISKPKLSFEETVSPSCQGDTLLLKSTSADSSGIGPFSFAWKVDNTLISDSSSLKTFLKEGKHRVVLKMTDGFGCMDSTVRQFNIHPSSPEASLSAYPTLITCWPGLVTFKDSSLEGKAGIAKWEWLFGDSTSSAFKDPTHIYTKPGSFDVQLVITDSIGCKDTIVKNNYINIRGPVGTFVLDTTHGYAPLPVKFTGSALNASKYIWDFGDGTLGANKETSHTFEKPGTYIPKMIVEDELGCKSVYEKDTITVIPCFPVPVNIDTTICNGNSIKLFTTYPEAQHEWLHLKNTSKFLANTSKFIEIDTAGTYILKNTFAGTPCWSIDTFTVKVLDLQFELGNDTTLCFGNSVTISPDLSNDFLFNWNNGETSFYTVAKESGQYMLKVRDKGLICEYNDSVNVTILPQLNANAGPDQTLCIGKDSIILSGSGGTIFNWQPTGESTKIIKVSPEKTTTYTLSVTDKLRCDTSSDIVNVMVRPLPKSPIDNEITHCFENSMYALEPFEGLNFSWVSSDKRFSRLEIEKAGYYHIEIFNEYNCSILDSFLVNDVCPPRLFVPKAFTPNNDGTNDVLEIFGAHFKNFQMKIFNRWGEIIYITDDPEKSWDGTYKGEKMPLGVYPWVITYESLLSNKENSSTLSGSVTVIE